MRLVLEFATIAGLALTVAEAEDYPIKMVNISGSYPIIRYNIENTSDRTIVVSKVSAGCSCQKTSIDKSVMHPGSTSSITLTAATVESDTPQPKQLVILTDDTKNPTIVIELQKKAEISPANATS